jgi:hypothetical protein
MQYLVEGTGGPGFATAAEALTVLESEILPGFEMLLKLEAEGKILAGGLPVADRAFVFVIDVPDNDAADKLIRNIPFWPVLQWKVTPLQSFAGRAEIERATVRSLKEAAR